QRTEWPRRSPRSELSESQQSQQSFRRLSARLFLVLAVGAVRRAAHSSLRARAIPTLPVDSAEVSPRRLPLPPFHHFSRRIRCERSEYFLRRPSRGGRKIPFGG